MVGIQRVVNQRATVGIAGQIADMDNFRVISLVNANIVRQLYTVTVDNAVDAVYSATFVDVFGESRTVTFDQGAAGIVENKTDGMIAAIRNDLVLSGKVVVVKTAANTYTVEARVSNIQGVLTTDANQTPVQTVAPVADVAIPFGRGIVFNDNIGVQGRLPTSAAAFARYTSVIGAAAGAGTYITVVAGVTFTYTGGGAETVTTIRDGLIALINASDAVAPVARAYAVSANTYSVVGLVEAPLVVTVAAGTGSGQTLTTVSAGVTGDRLIGVSTFTHAEPNDTKYDLAGVSTAIAGTDGYPVGASMNVLTKGVVWVETEAAVTVNQPVYCRAIVAGVERRGIFRGTADANDLVLVPNARWVRGNTGAGLAQLELM
jgi:hypothetical protein